MPESMTSGAWFCLSAVVVVLFYLFAWALCRIAAKADAIRTAQDEEQTAAAIKEILLWKHPDDRDQGRAGG